MSTIKRRVAALETRITAEPLTAVKQRQGMDDNFYIERGTTRERVIAEYGSEGKYVYQWMITPTDKPELPVPEDGLTVAERYMAMIRK